MDMMVMAVDSAVDAAVDSLDSVDTTTEKGTEGTEGEEKDSDEKDKDQDHENENENENKNDKEEKEKEKKMILSVPKFWDPPSLFNEGVRTFLGNYGERLMTPQEAKMIGSYVRPLDREEQDNKDKDETKNGQEGEEGLLETIFVSIASYRDYRCPNTVRQLFKQATYPERIRVAIVDQIDPATDVNCAKPERPCDEEYPNNNNNNKDSGDEDSGDSSNKDEDALCKYSHLIDVYEMDATLAVGPVLARHIGGRMYRGEYYAMQSDAHMEFVTGWDVDIIQQWKSAKNEMAVLTTYVSSVGDHYDKETGTSTAESRPKMCNTDFDLDYYDNRLANLMHGQQPEGKPDVMGEPTLSPFWAAGFSFSRGHFVIQVPYDQYLPMIFQGEEINIGLRGFTYGYDYYAPERSVLFHYYSEGRKDKKVKTFWEHSDAYNGLEQASMARLLSITELIPTAEDISKNKKDEENNNNNNQEKGESESENVIVKDAIEWNRVEEKKYGLGKARTVKKFLRTFGIDIVAQKVEHHMCRFVGKPMNEMFLAHRRENGMGVDYDQISFEFRDPEVYGKSWDTGNADDCCEEEEEEVVEEQEEEEEGVEE
eukprot:CAMPEP_0203686210 /NCGR_PEP_ID=MMETSP0090-20130426/48946_1 /ASSEMBLY_ACC=CAM_ASM_001088 /TAXON_ID=426623 /ORGANISM="Chaetoceros affinis, Strain CCMP159" /LENGTH=595 /DNA_ID=CAMNT_0050555431 /DNA_START=492 /DNA_END=2279 /DNA_ORIENTATION=-